MLKMCATVSMQQLGGHQNLSTTQRYLHLTPTALENAIRLLDPPSVPALPGNMAETAEGQEWKALNESKLAGVGDGGRTRDIRSHSPALCH